MSGTAQAAEVPNHPFIKTLIGGLVEEPKPPHPVLDAPCGVAVEPGGGILVSDYYRKKIFNTSLPELAARLLPQRRPLRAGDRRRKPLRQLLARWCRQS